MAGCRTDIKIRITKGTKTHGTLNIIGSNIKKLLPSEGGSTAATIKATTEAIQKFHKAKQVGVVLLLVGHDPSVGGGIMVELRLRGLFQKKYQKRS